MHEPQRPLKVFLCHSSQDKPVVFELYKRLLAEDWIDPWLDKEKLKLGQDFDSEIEKAIESADAVVAFISKSTVSKTGYIQKELKLIYNTALYKPEGRLFAIPLRLEECDPPYSLKLWHWGDYFGSEKEKTYELLLESLKIIYDQIKAEEKIKKDVAEKARLEAEELAKQKTAKEKTEREAAEMADREKAKRESAEKAERNRAEREAIERAKHEQAEREAAERAARKKAILDKILRIKGDIEKYQGTIAIILTNTLAKIKNWAKSPFQNGIPFLKIMSIVGVITVLFLISLWLQPDYYFPAPIVKVTETLYVGSTELLPNISVTFTETVTPIAIKSATVPPPSQKVEGVVSSDVFVRLGPGTNYPKVGSLRRGINVNVLGRYDNKAESTSHLTWYLIDNSIIQESSDLFEIITPDTELWVSAALVNLQGSVDNIPYLEYQSDLNEHNIPTLTVTSLPPEITDAKGISMMLVPAGTFEMGDSGNMEGEIDEKPEHSVYLDTFYMDKYEVTNQDFVFFLNNNYDRITHSSTYYLIDGQEAFSLFCDVAYNPNSQNQCNLWRDKISVNSTNKKFVAMLTDKDDPVVMITWYGALEYCKWRSDEMLAVTLPTEAQWEKAARGTQEILYPWGNEKNCKYANYKGCVGNASPVGSYASGISPYGIYDMAGNVREWVSDWYDGNYYDSLSTDISANPLGPVNGETKVFRGGSWYYDAVYARTTQRGSSFGELNTYSSLTVGFRCSGIP